MSLPEHRLILFTGSRNWTDTNAVDEVFGEDLMYRRDIIVEGGHRWHDEFGNVQVDRSLDAIAWSLAGERGFSSYTFRAPWDNFRKRAGSLRNEHMARLLPDYTYAFPLPGSKGTWDMVRRIKGRGLPGQYWTPDGWETW